MCGITGFIDYKKKTSMQDLRQMTDVMHHRGPDGSGYERIEQNNYVLGLGHRRLSIIDLTELSCEFIKSSYSFFSLIVFCEFDLSCQKSSSSIFLIFFSNFE